MATFGKTNVGGSYAWSPGTLCACKFPLSEAGDVTQMSIYFGANIPSDPDNRFRLGIYDDDGAGNHAGTLLAESGEGTSVVSSWNSLAVSASLSAGDFWLCWGLKSISHGVYRDAGSVEQTINDNYTYGALPDPFPLPGHTHGDYEYSVYATYTPSGAGLSIPVAMHHYMQQQQFVKQIKPLRFPKLGVKQL